MLDLEIELIVVLIIVAIIGIVMGRFLCKSGEKEEREEKKKVIYAYKTAQHQIGIYENQIDEHTVENHQLESQLSDFKQKYNNAQTALNISDNQREKLLKDLKVLEKYKSRFEALQNEFKLQNILLDELKGQKIKNLEKIGELETIKSNQEKSILNLNKKYQDSNSEIARLEAIIRQKDLSTEELELKLKEKYKAIIEEKDNAYKKLEEDKDKEYKDMLHEINSAYEKLEQEKKQEYKNMLEEKNSAYEKLEQEKIKEYKDMLQEKNSAYEKLEQEKNQEYRNMLEERTRAYEKLEQEKTKEYKDMVQQYSDTIENLKEEHTTSHIELKKEKDSIEDEYETFKINFNLDSDRLASLESDYEKMYDTLNRVIGERDDLLSRLRAISSVVGAVSVEKHEHIYQPLLEDNKQKDKK